MQVLARPLPTYPPLWRLSKLSAMATARMTHADADFSCFEVVDEEHSKTKIVLQLDTGMLWGASLFLLMGTHARAYAHITDSSEADPKQRAPAVRSPKTQNTPKKCGVSNGEERRYNQTHHSPTPRHSCVFRQLANTKPVPFFRVQ